MTFNQPRHLDAWEEPPIVIEESGPLTRHAVRCEQCGRWIAGTASIEVRLRLRIHNRLYKDHGDADP